MQAEVDAGTAEVLDPRAPGRQLDQRQPGGRIGRDLDAAGARASGRSPAITVRRRAGRSRPPPAASEIPSALTRTLSAAPRACSGASTSCSASRRASRTRQRRRGTNRHRRPRRRCWSSRIEYEVGGDPVTRDLESGEPTSLAHALELLGGRSVVERGGIAHRRRHGDQQHSGGRQRERRTPRPPRPPRTTRRPRPCTDSGRWTDPEARPR